MKTPSRLIVVEIWLAVMAVVIVVFVNFNGTSKRMQTTNEMAKQELVDQRINE